MSSIRFANIVLEQNPRAIQYPTLYCRGSKTWAQDSVSGDWMLSEKGVFDFTTYFNSLSVSKLRRYTAASRFFLHVELRGAACILTQTKADAFASRPILVSEMTTDLPSSDAWQSVDFELSVDEDAVLVGFQLETSGCVFIRNGYYTVDVDHELRDVNLLLSTTTFKKESYIEQNIKLVKKQILDCGENIANHFQMLVVDNGQTLDIEKLQSEKVTIRENANVGGAGGFTRGMIEALEMRPAVTHILLMDDDVALSPESIKRTYSLLRMITDDYASAFLSGAMLDFESVEDQWEDIGYMTRQGTFAPVKPPLRLTKFEDIVYNEVFRTPTAIKNLRQCYAAWWYCVVPTETIKANGLPLPVFVRCDDAEYSVRCAPKLMTMNGICIWHDSFHHRYNAAVERYQTMRNTLIAQYTTGFSLKSDFMQALYNNIRLELKKFGYENAELCLDAFEDFLKGPDFFSAPGMAEKTFMAANQSKEKLSPFRVLENEAHKLGLSDFNLSSINRQLIDSDKPRNIFQRINDFATNNGQRFIVSEGKGFAVIPSFGWAYPAGIIRGKRYLIVIDWYNRVGAIRVKNPKRYKEITKRYRRDLRKYRMESKKLHKAYSAARGRLMSVSYWKAYLNM